jgi:hypothetical protein
MSKLDILILFFKELPTQESLGLITGIKINDCVLTVKSALVYEGNPITIKND